MTKHLDRLMVSFLTLISLFFILPFIIYKLANDSGSIDTWLFASRLALIWLNIMLVTNLKFRAFFTSHRAYIINNLIAMLTVGLYIALNITEIITTTLGSNIVDAKNINTIMAVILAPHLLILVGIIRKLIIMKTFKSTPCQFNPLGYYYQNKKHTVLYYFDGETGKWGKSKADKITSPPKQALLSYCLKKLETSEDIQLPCPAEQIEESSPYKVIMDYCLGEGYKLSEDQSVMIFEKKDVDRK